jgi:hypothetical protein
MPKLLKSKTIWTCIVTGLTGLGFFVTGESNFVDTVKLEAIVTMIGFLRHAIAKVEL